MDITHGHGHGHRHGFGLTSPTPLTAPYTGRRMQAEIRTLREKVAVQQGHAAVLLSENAKLKRDHQVRGASPHAPACALGPRLNQYQSINNHPIPHLSLRFLLPHSRKLIPSRAPWSYI